MATRDTLSAKVDSDTKREVNRYKEQRGHEHRSDAVRELVQIGLRESTNPLVFRMKDRVVDWVSLLGIAAVIVFIAGATTNVIHVVDATKLSIALVSSAVVLLAVFELLRVATGSNEIGSVVRGLFRGEKA